MRRTAYDMFVQRTLSCEINKKERLRFEVKNCKKIAALFSACAKLMEMRAKDLERKLKD
jgi:hypothetical protein